VDDIPYQPSGSSGFGTIRNKDNAAPLGFGRALRTDYECFFAMQNLMLVGQALGMAAGFTLCLPTLSTRLILRRLVWLGSDDGTEEAEADSAGFQPRT